MRPLLDEQAQLLAGLFSPALAYQGLGQIKPGIPSFIIEAECLLESWDGTIERVLPAKQRSQRVISFGRGVAFECAQEVAILPEDPKCS